MGLSAQNVTGAYCRVARNGGTPNIAQQMPVGNQQGAKQALSPKPRGHGASPPNLIPSVIVENSRVKSERLKNDSYLSLNLKTFLKIVRMRLN